MNLRPRIRLCALITLLGITAAGESGPFEGQGRRFDVPVAASRTVQVGGASLQVDLAQGALDLPVDSVLGRIQLAAQAVAAYYGRFPVDRARVLVVPVPGGPGVIQGTTWGNMRGFPGFTRIRLGEHDSAGDLARDWVMSHEFVHMAFPSMPDDQHWMEEGQATYIEPIARVMIGDLRPNEIWGDMMRDMPKGEPQPGDQGLDHTHTWARTYWGGAMFLLVADVEIRRQTSNRKGLRDALRAVVASGGTIDQEWPLSRALATGDQATGTGVLTEMYARWKDAPVQVDLPKLFQQLGVRAGPGGVTFDDSAPLAKIRKAIDGEAKPAQSGRSF
ncbi:MAG TPA: hypothetical protein VM711_07090 [Sphingomicrobium sp.]|nr:hypothetical protein [Sphingomicrobium sp.]